MPASDRTARDLADCKAANQHLTELNWDGFCTVCGYNDKGEYDFDL